MDLRQIVESLGKTDLNKALSRIRQMLMAAGARMLEVDLISGVFFGWIETWLNGAHCPKCGFYLGDAREVPRWTRCKNCGKKIQPFKITPIKLLLAIRNNYNIFKGIPRNIKERIPDKIKGSLRSPFGRAVYKVYKELTLDMYFDPLLAWLRNVRPDLYYTIVFYPKVPEYVQTLYEIDFKIIEAAKLRELCEKLGLPKCNEEMLREVIVEAMDELVAEKKATLEKVLEAIEKGEMPKLEVEVQGLKWFATQVEELKVKGEEILETLIF